MAIYLKSIHIYPIKGLHGMDVEEATVMPRGLLHDRRWMITDEAGKFRSQRQLPAMALVRATPTSQGLRLQAAGVPDLDVVAPGTNGRRRTVIIRRDRVEALYAPQEAGDWLSHVLKAPCSLVFMDTQAVRYVHADTEYENALVSFADGYPLLLCTQESMADLNARMERPLSIRRFRPNVVLAGGTPFAEDHWLKIRIGAVRFHVAKPCARCQVTTVDQDTAQIGKEPLRTLSTFRKREGQVYFGENLVPQGPGILHVGDPVTVTAYRQ